MTAAISLIVGLGNPGARYADTWHNMGARVVEELARRWRCVLKPERGEYISAARNTPDSRQMLMIPASYMNLSGGPVTRAIRYYKTPLESVLIVLDDHDLPLGRVRFREKGSSGGHRGLDDVIQNLNTDEVPRLRIGILTDREQRELADQVLSKIPASLRGDVDKMTIIGADAVEKWLRDGFLSAANFYNGLDGLGTNAE